MGCTVLHSVGAFTLAIVRYTHTERQRQWQRQDPLEYMVMLPLHLGMDLGPIYQASQRKFQWDPI